MGDDDCGTEWDETAYVSSGRGGERLRESIKQANAGEFADYDPLKNDPLEITPQEAVPGPRRGAIE